MPRHLARAIAVLLFASAPAFAQDELKDEVEALRRKVDALTQVVRELQREVDALREDLAGSRTLDSARLTLALKDADLREVVKIIERAAGVIIHVPPGIQGTITLSITDVAWDIVLQTMVNTLGDYKVVSESSRVVRIVRVEDPKTKRRVSP